ncbi:MAG: molecular chaperone DnaK, partial [Spirosoma sp.]|nr:molecular chaperone DnaK [Spirosoma sp.]
MVPQEKKRYSEEDLQEFSVLINLKLDDTRRELNYIKESLSKR